MGVSAEVKELLRQGREEALAELALANPRALRPLVGRLWDPDPRIRGRAARAVGRAGAAHPDLGAEVIRRLMWALNDESATNGVYAIPALGEIGRRAPEMLAPYVPALVSMAWDGGIRVELLNALSAVAQVAPRLIVGHLDRLASFVDTSRQEERESLHRLVLVAGRGADDGD